MTLSVGMEGDTNQWEPWPCRGWRFYRPLYGAWTGPTGQVALSLWCCVMAWQSCGAVDCSMCSQGEEKIPRRHLLKGSPKQSSLLFQDENSQPWDNEMQITGAFRLLLRFIWSVLCNVLFIAGNNLESAPSVIRGVADLNSEQTAWPQLSPGDDRRYCCSGALPPACGLCFRLRWSLW